MSAPFRKTFRVRFCEWQTFNIDISARDATHAIALAQALRDEGGTDPFEELDGASDGWDAEEVAS